MKCLPLCRNPMNWEELGARGLIKICSFKPGNTGIFTEWKQPWKITAPITGCKEKPGLLFTGHANWIQPCKDEAKNVFSNCKGLTGLSTFVTSHLDNSWCFMQILFLRKGFLICKISPLFLLMSRREHFGMNPWGRNPNLFQGDF